MEKHKRWQFWLIVAVVLITLINIFPTIFYYTQPLRAPIDEQRAEKVARGIIDRVNSLEEDSKGWLESFSRHLGITPQSIELKENDPAFFVIQFKNSRDADVFKKFLTSAGEQIPFVPAQVSLAPQAPAQSSTVLVQREITVHLDPKEVDNLFSFVSKRNEDGQFSQKYRDLVYNRTATVAQAFAGPSRESRLIEAIAQNSPSVALNQTIISFAAEIDQMATTLEGTPLLQRYFSNFALSDIKEFKPLVQKWISKMQTLKTELEGESEQTPQVKGQIKSLDNALAAIKKHQGDLTKGKQPLARNEILAKLKETGNAVTPKNPMQTLSLEGKNPFVNSLSIDWQNGQILLKFYPDIEKARASQASTEESALVKNAVNQPLFGEIARASQSTEENIRPEGEGFAIALSSLQDVQSFLTFDLGFLAKKQLNTLKQQLLTAWTPTATDLTRENYPVMDWETFQKQNSQDQKLGLVLYAPANEENSAPKGFRNSSIYLIARGLEPILEKAQQAPDTKESAEIQQDTARLARLLQSLGFISYPGSSLGIDPAFGQDTIFEHNDYYTTLLAATREEFSVLGNQKEAVLDFTDVEQRIVTRNRIDDKIQESLVKWKEEYLAAQASNDVIRKTLVPPPDKSVFLENLKLTFTKYFRGDDSKVLKWGLDLSGGKTVRIGLRDQNGRPVTNPDDLKQAVNELYNRINKMGVAERTIRIENDNIILDFPGSQAFSAEELIKASAMHFHIVNEKFSSNPNLKDPVQKFLQNVWNEAVVTNRKDAESINEIAYKHLGGDTEEGYPRSDAAKILYENGLRLANPDIAQASTSFDDSLSTIGVMRGSGPSEWNGQNHPLQVLFYNYALEGSSLTGVSSAYDPSQGNYLSFTVRNSYEGSRSGSPREDFYTWTSQFAQDKIGGTPLEAYTHGNGWRMAVILNNEIITSPALKAAIREGGTISGKFTPREVSDLVSDLKAGSLSFTPRILSEQNVSPELGKEERARGISAALIGLTLVAIAMIGYYRFAGIVATAAVLLNLLIMWGVLQNIDAAITLPGIAGIVLTIGMAVDANVLVFERFREEFKISGRLASAMQAGYKKAFSAIVDSNITTIIAALILIQFDSGPIKGFAITLIIGIVSSMFTALFMTRYFFAGWVKNPKHTSLNFSQWVGQTNFDFLKQTKRAIIISIILMIVGGVLFFVERHTILGMDFTGGYSLNVELEETNEDINYRTAAIEAIESKGASSTSVEVRELTRPNQLRIQLSASMDRPGGAFYEMPAKLEEGKFTAEYQRDPRIVWTVDALESAGLKIQSSEIDSLHLNWSTMSGQLSDAMRNNALIALGFALLSVLIYITLRFEFKYAIAAVIALAHDVAITLGLLAFFRWAGLPVQIDLEVIGAIMTIIGYSLNDTIIVFDRIREDLHVLRKLSYPEVINHAINVTLSRTIMTSGTTLLVLISLVLLGGPSIFDFSLVMTLGVLVGTFSSLFVAGPVLLYFHNREETEEKARVAVL